MIYIDVDGCLANFVERLLHNYNSSNKTSYVHADVTDWEFSTILKKGERWKDYLDPIFWRGLDLYPWADTMVKAVRETGMPYAFLTNLLSEGVGDRHWWLDKMFTEDPKDPPGKRMVVAVRKELVAHSQGDILIDDSPTNIAAVRAVGATVLPLAQPWNQEVEAE